MGSNRRIKLPPGKRDEDLANAQFAHISYDREKYRRSVDKAWDVERMRGEMVKSLNDYLPKVVPIGGAWSLKSEPLAEAPGIGFEGGPPASVCRIDAERSPPSRVQWDDRRSR